MINNHERINIITNVFEFNRSITDVKYFSDRLRYARKLRGLSQSALARACGLSQSAIANYETKARQHAKEIFRIAAVLNVNAEWLGTGTGPMEASVSWPSMPATPSTVSDNIATPSPAWPFPSVSPQLFWSLTHNERVMLEQTVIGMLIALGKQKPGI